MKRGLFATLFASALLCASFVVGDASQQQQRRAASPKDRKDETKSAEAKEAKSVAERPRVREIDETGLKALFEESAKSERRLLVNFWATWCAPCRAEFPDLVRVDAEFEGRTDFEFITVSLDDLSEIETGVPEFLSEMRAQKMPAYLLNARDPEAVIALTDKSWRGELPATFLFGRKGELLYRRMGPVKAEELRAAIKSSDKQTAATSDK